MEKTAVETARQIGLPDLPESGRYSGAEVEDIKRRMLEYFRESLGQSDIKLYPSPDEWAYGFSREDEEYLNHLMNGGNEKKLGEALLRIRPQALFYHTEEICTRPPAQLRGLMDHEIAHAVHSDFAALVMGVMRADKEGGLGTTFATVQWGAEDARVNRLRAADLRSAGESIAVIDADWLATVPPRAGSQPLTMQFALNSYYYSLRGEFMSEVVDERVREACLRTEGALRRYIACDDAQAADQIMRREIWPVAKELETGEVNDRACALMRKDGVWKRIQRRLDRLSARERERLRKVLGRFKRRKECPEPPREVEERNRLLKVFERLSPERQEAWRRQARCELDSEQAEVCSRCCPKGLVFLRDSTGESFKLSFKTAPGEEQARQIRAWLYGLGEEIDRADAEVRLYQAEQKAKAARMNQAGFTLEEELVFKKYEKAWEETRPRVHDLVRELRRILPPSVNEVLEGEYYAGEKLDLELVRQKAAIGDYQVYRRRENHLTEDPLVEAYLVLDNTVSMGKGGKLSAARNAAILFMATFDALELPCGVLTAGEEVNWIKKVGQSYSRASDRVRPKLMEVFHAREERTDLGAPVIELTKLIKERMRRAPETTFIVIIVSDGNANSGLKGKKLKTAVNELGRIAAVSNVSLRCSAAEKRTAREVFGSERVVALDEVEGLSSEFAGKLKISFGRIHKHGS